MIRPLLLITISFLILMGCNSGKNDLPATESHETIDSAGNIFYKDDGEALLFIKNDGDSTKCYDIQSVDFKIMQLAPLGEWNTYVAKQTTITKSCDGQEGQQRTIKIELKPVDHPDKTFYVLQHDCDEVYLEHDYYRTVVHGCCDAEPVQRIYDYEGHLLLSGNVKVLIGAIPNNPLKFYVGYTPTEKDTSTLGTVHLTYNNDKRYDIRIKSSPLPPELCSIYSPALYLVSTKNFDTLEVYQDEYQLWDLEQIDSIPEFNNIAIKVTYQCDPAYQVNPILIPITRGKPFGKDSVTQQIRLVHRVNQ